MVKSLDPASVPMSSPLASAPDVTKLFGPMLIGAFLNTLLYGIMLVQAFLYYHRYRGDRSWFRYLVLYLVVVETVNWICDVGLIYEPLIIRYGTAEALEVSPLLLRADAVLTVLISTPIQLFIAWRVRLLTNSFALPAVIALLAIVSFGGGIATTTIVTLHPEYASFPNFRVEVVTWLVSSTTCDVFLTGALVYSLWIRKTNVISTDSYINKIIRLSVQTGLLTAAAALLDMIFFLALPNTSVNFSFDFCVSKLYTNALISTLNARPWQERVSAHEAPNALFEDSNGGSGQRTTYSTSFSMVHRLSVQPFPQEPRPSKMTFDISPVP
ncbi:hypothetical protein B0H13DRAFT_1201156 [Mycena leptocephala]|nr:hypothetical protein B0H13DRAFT_1201156 [Mycena leptocephala]